MNTLYSAKSIKLITENVISSETYVTEISKGFKLNENAPLVEVNESTQQLATLTSNNYIDIIVNFDFPLKPKFELIPAQYSDEFWEVSIEQELISILVKNYIGSGDVALAFGTYFNYGYADTTLRNLKITRTSTSGMFNVSVGSSVRSSDNLSRMLYVTCKCTDPWTGTIDDTEAVAEINWIPYQGIEKIQFNIPVKVQSMLGE